jgi:ABC-type branched-subunit amino acid transport system ATPase component
MPEAGVGTGEPRMPAVAHLFERDTELALLEGLIGQVSVGTGALAVIEGHCGIGKTSLLAIACDRARAAGLVVVSGRGGVLDREQPFGIARRLLDALVEGARCARYPRVRIGRSARCARSSARRHCGRRRVLLRPDC